jgi:methylglutaconyl-CoA hydratase
VRIHDTKKDAPWTKDISTSILGVLSWQLSILICGRLTGLVSLVYGDGVSTQKPLQVPDPTRLGVRIERAGDVLTFILDNAEHGNEVSGAMFDAMLSELQGEASRPGARVLRIRALGKVFCAGRERAGRDVETIRREAVRLIELKRWLRGSALISIAEVQGDAFGFGFGLAIVCDFALVSEHAALGFPEMRSGLAPSAVMAYLGEYALPRFTFPLVLFGDPISPQLALQHGLISQVCAADRLAGEADALVDRILRLDPFATRRCKQFFQSAQQNAFDENCRLAAEALTIDSLARLARRK